MKPPESLISRVKYRRPRNKRKVDELTDMTTIKKREGLDSRMFTIHDFYEVRLCIYLLPFEIHFTFYCTAFTQRVRVA